MPEAKNGGSGSGFGARLVRAAAGTAAGVGLAAGCAASPEAAPAAPREPMDVRVTALSPEVVDELAAGVAERLSAMGYGARPGRSAGPAGRAPAVPPVAPRVRQPVRERRAPPPAAPVSEADLAQARESVDLALQWLARHQSESGAWSSADFSARCSQNRCDGPGDSKYDVGVTGLALLAFLGGGNTHTSGPHAEVVKKGLSFLRTAQDPQGCIGTRQSQHFMYNHAYGTWALVEAYGLTTSPVFRESAQRGVDFILQAQNPYLGWRYGIRDGDNDTSVTGLMTTVLCSARSAGLAVDPGSFRGALSWFDKMTDPEFGRVGYQQRGGPPARTMEAQERFPALRSESLTAVGTAARILAGENPESHPHIRRSAELIAATPPEWDVEGGSIDFYYWYWGTLALQQTGGAEWEAWKFHLVRALPAHQRREEPRDERGSWDAIDAWSSEGGRVYATAMACLACEIVGRSGKAAR